MLQKLNERIQGVVAWLVIVLIALTFTLFGVDYYMQAHQTSNAKILVNEQAVTNQAFETNYRRARAQQDIEQMTAAGEKNLQTQVLNQMVTNEVSLQSARHFGFDVTPEQANAAIVKIPQFQEDGHFSTEKYQQTLSGALFTPESFQNEVRQGMLLNQQRFAFMGSSFALPDEITRFVRLYMQTRDYDYLTINVAALEREAAISPDAIKEYYNAHQKEFMSPEQVSIDYVVLSMNDIRAKVEVSDEDIQKYYNENQNNYLTPAQWQVAHILFAVPENASQDETDEIQKKADNAYSQLQSKPELFDTLVQDSDDKLSLADKGVLPWITAGENEYNSILSGLTVKGDISAPEKTKHGFEIFKLIDYKPVNTKSLAQVQSLIKEQLSTDLAQANYAHALEQLTDLSYQSPDSLTPVADSLKLKIKTSKAFSRSGGADDVSSNKQVINTSFSHDVLTLGNNSEPVQLDNDRVLVLRVKQHIETKEQSFAEVETLIKKLLTHQFAEHKAQDIVNELLKPEQVKKQQDVMAAHHLAWTSVTTAARDSDKADAAINEAAFNLLHSTSRNSANLANGDIAVVMLKQINDGDLDALDEEQKDSLEQQIQASFGMMDYDLYVNGLVKSAQISQP